VRLADARVEHEHDKRGESNRDAHATVKGRRLGLLPPACIIAALANLHHLEAERLDGGCRVETRRRRNEFR
jgi:hypothetical protein